MRSFINFRRFTGAAAAVCALLIFTPTTYAQDVFYESIPGKGSSSDERAYIFGSVGYSDYDLSDEDVSDGRQPGALTADDDDIAFRGGFGYRLNETLAFEVSFSDLGSPVNIIDPGALNTLKVDINYDEVFEFSFVNVFDSGTPYHPVVRIGGFSFDGDLGDDGGNWMVGFGIQRERFRLEVQRYDFEPEEVDTIFLSYLLPLDF